MATKYFMNGGVNSNWSTDGNWSTTASSGPANTTKAVSTDDVILNSGSPACIIDVASASISIVCTGYTNTLTFNGTLTVTGTVTFASGMTIAGTSDLICASTGSPTLTSGGKTLTGGLRLQGSGPPSYTFSGAWVVNGALTINGVGFMIGSTIAVGGGLTMLQNINNVGTTVVTLTGGTWSGDFGFGPALIIAGNVTISGQVRKASSSLTYSSGTLAGVSTPVLYLYSIAMTVTGFSGSTAATGQMQWDLRTGVGVTLGSNINVNGKLLLESGTTTAGAFTITATSCDVSVTFTMTGNIQINGLTSVVGSCSLNGVGKFFNTYGLTLVSNNSLSGTATLKFNGTGTWQHGGVGILNMPTTIDCGASTLTIGNSSGQLNVNYGTSTFTYTSGSITWGASANTYIAFASACTIDWPSSSVPMRMAYFNAAVTYTITSLYATHIYLGEAVANTFAGVGFTCVNLLHNALTGNRTHTFVNLQTYTVTGALTLGTTGFVLSMTSNHGTNRFNLVLQSGGTQSVKFVTATRIDSSAGQTIYDLGGTLTSTVNWSTTIPSQSSGPPAIGFAG